MPGRELLLIGGVGLAATGLLLVVISALGAGPLAGVFRWGGVTVVIPVVLCLILSVALTLLLNLLVRLR
jgi:Protein of unknown function (DUF2905)